MCRRLNISAKGLIFMQNPPKVFRNSKILHFLGVKSEIYHLSKLLNQHQLQNLMVHESWTCSSYFELSWDQNFKDKNILFFSIHIMLWLLRLSDFPGSYHWLTVILLNTQLFRHWMSQNQSPTLTNLSFNDWLGKDSEKFWTLAYGHKSLIFRHD